MDKFCLKWNEFDTTVRDYFKNLRQDKILFDVTLVTSDGKHNQAHKIILSAGSKFFRNIFQKSIHSNNILIYLKGISSAQLDHLLDFMYNGEAFVNQEDINIFTETAAELQVKGLECDDITEAVKVFKSDDIAPDKSEEVIEDSKEVLITTCNSKNQLLKTDDANDMDPLLQDMVERNGNGVWKCKFCGKMRNKNTDILRHAQKHIDVVQDVSIDCHICYKTFVSKPSLQNHISTIHSGLFSCDICEISGMNRMTYREHKRIQH